MNKKRIIIFSIVIILVVSTITYFFIKNNYKNLKFGNNMSNKNIIQINLSGLLKLNEYQCSNTLHSKVFKDFFNLKENDGNVITHWNILNTQYHTIEVNNDEELGSLFFLSKKHNINWYGYIYIVE